MCTAAQTGPGSPLALRINIPAPAAPCQAHPPLLHSPSSPRTVSGHQESKHRKLFTARETRSFLLPPGTGSCYSPKFSALVKAPGAALHRALTFFSGIYNLSIFHPLHVSIPATVQKTVQLYLFYFFLLILSSSMNKVRLCSTTLKAGQIATERQKDKEIKYLKMLHSSIRNHQK